VEVSRLSRVVEGVTVSGDSIPSLACPSCRSAALPVHVEGLVHEAARKARGHGQGMCNVTLEGRRFALCEDVGFAYSSMDMEVIPGVRQSGLDPEGHYVPIFFEPRVLSRYMMFDAYAINHYETGGSIHFSNGFDLEYGINRNGKVFCWLGDLARIPVEERHYMRSENIPSDHDVVSGMYKKTRLRMPVGRTCEQELTGAIRGLVDALDGSEHSGLFSLSGETMRISQSLARPVVWDRTVMIAVNDLSKLCVDSFNEKVLRRRIRSMGGVDSDISGIPALLGAWLGSEFHMDARGIVDPLHVLKTWRNSLDHVWDGSSARKIGECYGIMGLDGDERTPERLYGRTVEGLIHSFRYLAKVIEAAPDRAPA